MRWSSLSLSLFVCLMLGPFAIPRGSLLADEAIDLEKVAQEIRRNWRAVESVAIRGEELGRDENGQRDTSPGLAMLAFETRIAKGGKRAHREVLVSPDGKRRSTTNVRQDGRKIYQIRPPRADLPPIATG